MPRLPDPKPTALTRLSGHVAAFAARGFALLCRRLSADTLTRALSLLLRCAMPRVVARIHDQLRMVYGARLGTTERRALAERVVENVARTYAEVVLLPSLAPEELRRRTRVYGAAVLRRAEAAGQGVLVASAHYGNFESMAAWFGASGLPLVVVAREVPQFDAVLGGARARHGVGILPTRAWRAALGHLRRGARVALLVDEPALTGGTMVEFLGYPATCALGPPLLARHSGALVVPMFITRDPDGRFEVQIHHPVELPDTGDEDADLRRGAQVLTDVVARQVRVRPEEYHWFQPRWKPPRALRERPLKLARALGRGAPAEPGGG